MANAVRAGLGNAVRAGVTDVTDVENAVLAGLGNAVRAGVTGNKVNDGHGKECERRKNTDSEGTLQKPLETWEIPKVRFRIRARVRVRVRRRGRLREIPKVILIIYLCRYAFVCT